MRCTLCHSDSTEDYHADSRRLYRQCRRCRLVFVPHNQHLSEEQEKAEYDLHRNRPQDTGYRRFLSRVFIPMTARLPVSAQGLDFGCGPGPTLSVMFAEAGYSMDVYDKFYAMDRKVFGRLYDFITCTEVVEHLAAPGETLNTLFAMLNPGGWLGVMTKMVIDQPSFATWHYKNDMTHVAFFSRETFQWLAGKWRCHLEFIGNDVILLQKSIGNGVNEA
jgi:hypothetical protein